MYEFHTDKSRYFDMQYRVTREFILPYLREHTKSKSWDRVLEIGCGEAGVLKCFVEEGSFCTGIELSEARIASAEQFHAEALAKSRIEFVNRNIYDIQPEHDLGGRYDLVLLKDVIEHIPSQNEFLHLLPFFLREGGVVFFAFPPWQMPFGGHQQVCRSKVLSHLPYFHLLPAGLYRFVLRLFGESRETIAALMDIQRTGISIERFERYLKSSGFRIRAVRHYFFNPIYSFKFGIQPRVLPAILSAIPYLRDFITTSSYYIVDHPGG